MKYDYTLEEILNEVEVLKGYFDMVKLVNPFLACEIDKNGKSDIRCYTDFKKKERCKNCLASVAIMTANQKSSIISNEEKMFYFSCKPIKINGKKYALEMVSKINDKNENIEQKLLEEINLLRQEVIIDNLTGVYNRRFLNEQMELIRNDIDNKTSNIAIVICDIDYFKEINDTFGHQIGDEIIISVANVLIDSIIQEKNEAIVRLGGDEFVILTKGREKNELEQMLRNIMINIHQIRCDSVEIKNISLSIGAAYLNDSPDLTAIEVLGIADKNMYKAKEYGRDCAFLDKIISLKLQ